MADRESIGYPLDMCRLVIACLVALVSTARAACPVDAKRDAHRMPDQVVAQLALAPGMTVVDLGAGDGYFLCRLSHAVGMRGRVIATEVGTKLVRALGTRVAREQLANVDVQVAPLDDVGIGPAVADRILVVNVWHHIAKRERYAVQLARALAPGGVVMIVDFMPGGGHGIKPERVIAELAAGGIDAALIPEELPGQYVIVGSVRGADTCDPRLGLSPRIHCIQR
jgi:predicted methyltransferase